MAVPDLLPRNRRTGAFERRVDRAASAFLSSGQPIVVACSGGPDSVAALVAMARRPAGGAVVAASFNHGLRCVSETDADRTFVREIAARVGAHFEAGEAEERLSGDEESAREARYRWLAEVCERHQIAVCVTGHTQDDQAETVLMRLARGSGLRGAAGMRAHSAWPTEAPFPVTPTLLRPLLGISREALEDYLDALTVEPRRDLSNEVLAYARNRVRRQVIPALALLGGDVSRRIAEFADRARLDDEALQSWAEREFAASAAVEAGRVLLPRSALRALPHAVAVRVLRLAAHRCGLAISARQCQLALAAQSRGGYQVSLKRGTVRSLATHLEIARELTAVDRVDRAP